MPAISRDLQKTIGRRVVLILFAVAAVVLGIGWSIHDEPDPHGIQNPCLAAHAVDYGITEQQLMHDVSYQPKLVAALSSCYGMAP